jgi:hypothetical protein
MWWHPVFSGRTFGERLCGHFTTRGSAILAPAISRKSNARAAIPGLLAAAERVLGTATERLGTPPLLT